MKPGTKLYLPITVSESEIPTKDNPVQRKTFSPSMKEIKYIQSLEIYKEYFQLQYQAVLIANLVTVENKA